MQCFIDAVLYNCMNVSAVSSLLLVHIQISYTYESLDDEDSLTIIVSSNETTIYHLLTGLRPGTQYQIIVMASTSVGQGAATEVLVTTSSNSKFTARVHYCRDGGV